MLIDNFEYVNLAGVFDDSKDEIFIDSNHFGDRGNEIIAKAIAAGIEKIAR